MTRYDLPEGDLKWSYLKPENAKMCLPAAFTEMNGEIKVSYRYEGKNYQHNRYYRKVSLKDDMFFISKNWLSDNGFQQLTLVCDSKASRFCDSRRKVRRALFKDENGAFILQSNYPMTLSDLQLSVANAVPALQTWIWENMVMLRKVVLQDRFTYGDSLVGTNKLIGYI